MIRLIAVAVVAGFLSACAGSSLPKEARGRPGLDYQALVAAPSRPVSEVRQRVTSTATALLGTPYKFGGTTPAGFDCTGYVQYVFRKAAGLSLPRTSIDQIQSGEPLRPTEAQPGDLVYFRIDGEKNLHLGIYLGEGRFIHAPSSGGVVNVQSMGAEYWRARFLGARQVLDS